MPKTINIDVPDVILENYKNADDMEQSLYEDMIIREYQKGNISIREAAEILGLTYEGFMEWLGERKISFINASKEELEQDYKEFEEFMERHEK